MKILLLQDVDNLGHKGDIVTVRDGYGRNYLIPGRMAVLASDAVVRHQEELVRQRARKIAEEVGDAERVKEQLEAAKVVIAAKVGQENRIFGTVTPTQIAQALGQQGFRIDRKHIVPDEDIRMLGVYTATVKVHKSVSASLKVEVVAEAEA